jgi:hypothetical protein
MPKALVSGDVEKISIWPVRIDASCGKLVPIEDLLL